MTKKQKAARKALENTLQQMDSEEFWARVMKKYSKHCDAMGEVRRKSLEKAQTKVLR